MLLSGTMETDQVASTGAGRSRRAKIENQKAAFSKRDEVPPEESNFGVGENKRNRLGHADGCLYLNGVIDLAGGDSMMVIFMISLLILLFVLLWLKTYVKPKRQLVYSDATGAGRVLINEKWGIRGKPDEIWKYKDGTFLVVEYKSGTLKRENPYYGDRLQLAAYFLLVEEFYQAKMILGEIRYQNQICRVKWTPQLKRQLFRILQQMREVERTKEAQVKIYLPKCRQCEFYKVSCNKV